MIYPSLSDRPLVCEIVYIQSRYDTTIMMMICVQCNLFSWLRNLQLTTSLDNKLNWCSFRYLTALL